MSKDYRQLARWLVQGMPQFTYPPAARKVGDQKIEFTLGEIAELCQAAYAEGVASAEAGTPDSGMEPETQYVYFFQRPLDLAIKIGTSKNPALRRGQLAAQNGPLIELARIPSGYQLERYLHARFAASRIEGEWFQSSAELSAIIAAFGGEAPR